jgi:Rod binding domain-containing protein
MAAPLSPAFSTPGLTPAATDVLASKPKAAAGTSAEDKARGAAQDFEAVFLNSMFQQMFESVGNGPFGGGPAAGIWRSLLTDEYSKSFAKAGGVGIADHVQRALLAQQEIR